MPDFVDELVADWRQVDSNIDPTPIEVVSRIIRASQLIQQRLDALLASEELSHKGDLDTLTALRRAGSRPLSPSKLAQAGQLTSGGMTNRLDRLESAGLIRRDPDPDDRRSVLVALTAHGTRVADRAFQVSLDRQRQLLAALSDSDRAGIADGLRTLLISLGDDALEAPSRQATAASS